MIVTRWKKNIWIKGNLCSLKFVRYTIKEKNCILLFFRACKVYLKRCTNVKDLCGACVRRPHPEILKLDDMATSPPVDQHEYNSRILNLLRAQTLSLCVCMCGSERKRVYVHILGVLSFPKVSKTCIFGPHKEMLHLWKWTTQWFSFSVWCLMCACDPVMGVDVAHDGWMCFVNVSGRAGGPYGTSIWTSCIWREEHRRVTKIYIKDILCSGFISLIRISLNDSFTRRHAHKRQQMDTSPSMSLPRASLTEDHRFIIVFLYFSLAFLKKTLCSLSMYLQKWANGWVCANFIQPQKNPTFSLLFWNIY